MTKNHATPAGIIGEPVQLRDEKLRQLYANNGRVVGSRHIVEVEYNDFDGNGPYTVEHNIYDLERPFPQDCEATARLNNDPHTTHICGMPLDYRGACPVAERHVKEGS